MAKYLKKFSSESEYNSYINGDNVYLPNVSLIGTSDVRYNPIVIEAGNIVYYNGSALKFCKPTDWSSSLGTPVAVVVVPNTHTPDCTVRCIAVKGVSPDGSQANGNFEMEWGPMETDTGLPNLTQVPNYDNTVGGTIYAEENGYLSSNKGFTGSTDCLDSNLKYFDTSGSFIPNPYLPDGSPNSDFRNTSIVTNNACADFNGASNTSVLVGLSTAYTAANACHLYSTSGISAGNWYLPAMGELAYIMPRWNEIQNALNAVGGVQLDAYECYWSSSEFDTVYANNMWTDDSLVSCDDKDTTHFVRCFCALPFSLGF